MGKYGCVAKIAAQSLASGNCDNPRSAWFKAAFGVFPDSKSSRNKSCPLESFLALCQTGIVNGVASGCYTKSDKNKGYIDRALKALRLNPELSNDKTALWRITTAGAAISHNGQMDVLTTLWLSGFIGITATVHLTP